FDRRLRRSGGRRESLSDPQPRVGALRGFDDRVQPPGGEEPFGGQQLTAQAEPATEGVTELAAHPYRRARAGDEVVADMPVTDQRAGLGEDGIAGQRDLQATGNSMPVQHGDDR